MIHNQLQYHGDLGRGIARVVGLDENEEGLIRVSETLQPVFDPWSRVEFAFPRREITWSAFSLVAQVVAEFSMVAIINESDNALVFVDQADAEVQSAVAGTAIAAGFASKASLIATLGPSGILSVDRRHGFASVRTRLWAGTDPAFPFSTRGEQHRVAVVSETIRFDKVFPCVLAPDTGVWIECATANQAMEVNLRGRERQALPGELRVS